MSCTMPPSPVPATSLGDKLRATGKQNLVHFIKNQIKDQLSFLKQEQDKLKMEFDVLRQNFKVLAQEQLDLVNLVMTHHGYLLEILRKNKHPQAEVVDGALAEGKTAEKKRRKEKQHREIELVTNPSIPYIKPSSGEQMEYLLQTIMDNYHSQDKIVSLMEKMKAESQLKLKAVSNMNATVDKVQELPRSGSRISTVVSSMPGSVSYMAPSKSKRKRRLGRIMIPRVWWADSRASTKGRILQNDEDNETACQTEKSTLSSQKHKSRRHKDQSAESCPNSPKFSLLKQMPSLKVANPYKRVTMYKASHCQTKSAYEKDKGGSGKDKDVVGQGDDRRKDEDKIPGYMRPRDTSTPRHQVDTVGRLFNLLDDLKNISVAGRKLPDPPDDFEVNIDENGLVDPTEPIDYGNLGQWKNTFS